MRRESIILTDSILQESKYLFKKKLTNCPKYSWCSAKVDLNTQVFMVLSKRVVGAFQKNRRCFLKEATMLRGSSQYTFRNHLTAMPWEIVVW